MGYSRGTLNYLERISLSDPTHMISMVDLVVINTETLHIDSRFSFEKDVTELSCMNP